MQKFSKKGHPYVPAKLKSHINAGKERYHISFSIWNQDTLSLQRVRKSYMLNEKNMPYEVKMHHAEELIKQINSELYEGKTLSKSINKNNQSNFSIKQIFLEALEIFTNNRGLSPETIRHYKAHINQFISWLEKNDLHEIAASKFTTYHFQTFLDYLKVEKNHSNKTRNHHHGTIITFKNEIKKRNKSLWKDDPFDGIDKLKVKTRKHAAFTNGQMIQFKEYCESNNLDNFFLYIQFAYYTLARPNEIYHIRIKHIDMELGRILIVGETAKTEEEYCAISPALKKVIEEKGLMDLPPDFRVFGSGGAPGTEKIGKNYFYRRNVKMLEHFGLVDKRHTLYAYKHTGAISLYMATKDIKLLQMQMRHTTVSQTEAYLRDLGLDVGFSGLDKWEGAI